MLRLVSSSIRLSDRKEYKKSAPRFGQRQESVFVGDECHTYSFPFIMRKSAKTPKQPKLAITSITLAEDKCFNTGSSLAKWSKKRPRMKSSKSKNKSEASDIDNDKTDYDLSHIMSEFEGRLFHEDDPCDNDSMLNLEYDIHTDIEELRLKTQREKEEEEGSDDTKIGESKRHHHHHHHHHKSHSKKKEDSGNKKSKKKLKKTLKFSVSKPASPETERVIRVDLVSNMTVEEFDVSSRSGAGEESVDEVSKEGEYKSSRLNVDQSNFVINCRKVSLNERSS